MPRYYTDPMKTMRNRNARSQKKKDKETAEALKGIFGLVFLPVTLLWGILKAFFPKKKKRSRR